MILQCNLYQKTRRNESDCEMINLTLHYVKIELKKQLIPIY